MSGQQLCHSPGKYTHFSEFCALPEGACAPALPNFLLGKLREGRGSLLGRWPEQLLYKSKFCFLELVLFDAKLEKTASSPFPELFGGPHL